MTPPAAPSKPRIVEPFARTLPKYIPIPPPSFETLAKLSIDRYIPSNESGTVSIKHEDNW